RTTRGQAIRRLLSGTPVVLEAEVTTPGVGIIDSRVEVVVVDVFRSDLEVVHELVLNVRDINEVLPVIIGDLDVHLRLFVECDRTTAPDGLVDTPVSVVVRLIDTEERIVCLVGEATQLGEREGVVDVEVDANLGSPDVPVGVVTDNTGN